MRGIRVALLAVLVAIAGAASARGRSQPTAPPPDGRYEERVDVALVELEVRALTPQGDAIEGLGADDFRVTIDGRELPVESVDWVAPGKAPVPSTTPIHADEPALAVDLGAPTSGDDRRERLVVVFVQASFEPSRLSGHLRMLPRVRKLVDEQAGPDTLVAIVSFDSHLHLRQDFTRDRELLHDALDQAFRQGGRDGDGRAAEPSLGLHLDPVVAFTAASPERGVEITADALADLPGGRAADRAVIYVGWGLGNYTPEGVVLGRDYRRASEALRRSRVPVYVLDVTDADYHSLEVGLQQVAADTGGTYAKTHLFPDQAIRRLEGTLAGHYVLSVSRPAGLPAKARVSVELRGRKGTVLVLPGI